MNAVANSSTQLFERSAPTFTFDRNNRAIVALLRYIGAGYCCQVLGPRRHLKSRLIQEAGAYLTQDGTHHVIYLDLARVRTDDRFFANLAASTQAALPSLPDSAVEECQSAIDLQFVFKQLATANRRKLLLMIDHLEIAPPNLVASLLSAVRAAHTVTMDDYYGSRFQAVVCGSLLLSQVALRDADRFESISQSVMVPDLGHEESRRLLAACLAAPQLTITDDAAGTLLAWLDGDPLLITEAATILGQLATIHGRAIIDRDDASAAIQEMGRAIGAQTPLIDEAVRHITNDVRLLTVVRRLLEHAQPTADSVDSQEMRTLLELSGVVARRRNTYHIKSAAWEYLLRARLGTGYVGRLFARAGDWGQAITYLGQAHVDPAEENQDYRPELFAAIINAIHDSRDERRAFACLNDGLQAAYPYPGRDMLVYALDPDERALKLITAVAARQLPAREKISLGESDRPEVQACSGTEYSISLVDGRTRLLYPLLPTDARGDPLGLVLADERGVQEENEPRQAEPARSGDGYQPWEEREVLLGFLRSASRALMSKQRFHELLDSASQRAELWWVLDRIKTLLHDPDLSEETVWRVMLEGITHGRGLRFNRAVLFTPDATGRLLARHAVGHAHKAAAEAYWRLHPHTEQPTDEWLASLVERHRKPSPKPEELERSLRGLAVMPDENDSQLAHCFRTKEPIHGYVRLASERPALPEAIGRVVSPADEFVLVPLLGARGPLGALYADNKFTGQRIPGEHYRMLHNFVAQVALVVEGARALTAERHLRHLEQTQREQLDHDLADLQELQRALQFNVDSGGDEPLAEVVRAELGKVCQTALGTQAWLVRVCPRDRWQIVTYGGANRYNARQTDQTPPDPGRDNPDDMSPRTLSFVESVSSGLSAYLRTGNEGLVVAPIEVNGNHQATLYVEVLPGSTVTNREKVVERAANRLGVVISQVQNVQVLQRLVDSALRLTRDEPLDETLHNIVGEAMEVLSSVSTVTLYAINEQDDIVLAAYQGERFPNQMKSRPPYDSTVVEHIVKRDTKIVVTDVSAEPLFQQSGFANREGIRSVAAYPLISGGRHLGCMFFGYRRRHLFPDAEISALSLFAQLAAAELLYDRLDRELKKKAELEQYIVQGTLGNEFIHRLDGTIAGMLDHIEEIDDLVGTDPAISELLDLLRIKTDGLGRLSADIRQRLNGLVREVKRELRPLGPFVEQVMEQVKREAPPNVNMSFHSSMPTFTYAIDPLFVESLLSHLLRNAWDAIPDSRDGRIEVTLEEHDNWIRIAVRDNGLGIAEAYRIRVFEPLFSTKNSSKERGRGLTISSWIAKLHGGRLALGPSDTTGTTFFFDLPVETE